MLSMKFWKPLGASIDARLAALANKNKNIAPNTNEKPSVSTCSAINPISFASMAFSAKPQ